MPLLQDPLKALDQSEWYLENAGLEQFPGAFELAAGNLCRQTLEQALFVLCFYSQMPRHQFVRTDRTLKTAGTLVKQLQSVESATGKTYWDIARSHCERVAKFAKKKRSLVRWARDLNEPSHFALRFRTLRNESFKAFIDFCRGVFDCNDRLLIIAAVNELFSNGRLWVSLSGKDNLPCVYRREVVRMKNFARDESGKLYVSTQERPFKVIADNEIPRGPWPRAMVIPVHCVGIGLGIKMVTPNGDPVDLNNFETIIRSFSKTPAQRAALRLRFKQLGYELEYSTPPTDNPKA